MYIYTSKMNRANIQIYTNKNVARSTIMNFFRIPLNFIVVVLLSQDISLSLIFKFCVASLSLATLSQHVLYR